MKSSYNLENKIIKIPKNLIMAKLDIEFLRQVTVGDIEFEKELFLIFLESSKNNLDRMEKSITDKNDTLWHLAAHSFKGASASIGAFDLSKTLEAAQYHPKGFFEEKTLLLEKIRTEFDLVVDFIDKQTAN
jgi:HPt (histidine-containing phosphotransfer) domain-containing protein